MGYVPDYAIKSFSSSGTESLPPHKFVQVSWKVLGMAALHFFKLELHPVPIALYVLCVRPSNWINKVKTMINCCMTGDVGECADSIVSSPFVRIDCGSRPNMRVNYREKSGSIPSGYNFHVPQSRCVTHIDHPKHPYLLYRSPTSVILREKNNVDVNYLESITIMMYLWLVAEQTFIYLNNLSRSTQDDGSLEQPG